MSNQDYYDCINKLIARGFVVKDISEYAVKLTSKGVVAFVCNDSEHHQERTRLAISAESLETYNKPSQVYFVQKLAAIEDDTHFDFIVECIKELNSPYHVERSNDFQSWDGRESKPTDKERTVRRKRERRVK